MHGGREDKIRWGRSDVADLDLVEARVHLAAAQYHNSLANGKLVPRPPGLPRSRPAPRRHACRRRSRRSRRDGGAAGVGDTYQKEE
eukprot:g21521.t1